MSHVLMERRLSHQTKYNAIMWEGLNPFLSNVQGPNKIEVSSREQFQFCIIVE